MELISIMEVTFKLILMDVGHSVRPTEAESTGCLKWQPKQLHCLFVNDKQS